MRKQMVILLIVVGMLISAGCMNMPTPPAQITGSYISALKYESFDCSFLAAELNSLSRRENQLIVAQRQRIKTSEMQAFWYGFGQGDGLEASELATVRGEKEAVYKVMERKNCDFSRVQTEKLLPLSEREKRAIRAKERRRNKSGGRRF